jgi:hypothetical protein
MHMKMTAWAVLGSLFINLMLGLLVATVFSVAPPARAAELYGCSGTHPAVLVKQTPPHPAAAPSHHSYLVEVRMGWAVG